MERVFITYFEFYGKTYTSRVRQQFSREDLSLDIEVPDESLFSLLPNGRLVYSSRKGLQAGAQDNLLSRELVGCIVRSVEPYLG